MNFSMWFTGHENQFVILILLFIFSYLAASLNFSIILFRFSGKSDPRSRFSKNAGATNVYRQAGLWYALIVLILDMGRGMGIALLSGCFLREDLVPVVGLGLVLGNSFPCFHHFQGGKGVATWLGFTAGIAPVYAGISILVWIGIYMVCKTPFISSFAMILILSMGIMIHLEWAPLSVAGSLSTLILICFNHRSNVTAWRHGSGHHNGT